MATPNLPQLNRYCNKRQMRQFLIERDGPFCRFPGCDHTETLTIHHLLPLTLGGTNLVSNLCLLCRTHHDLVHWFVHLPQPHTFPNLVNRKYLKCWEAFYNALNGGVTK